MSSFPDRGIKWNNERAVSWNISVVKDAKIFFLQIQWNIFVIFHFTHVIVM